MHLRTYIATHTHTLAELHIFFENTSCKFHGDGQDVAYIDVEIADARGERCPTDYARVDFAISGPGIWRGGYNSGIVDSTNNLYLYTECGINRVFVRSTLQPGRIAVTASRPGLRSGDLTLITKPVNLLDGLSTDLPPRLNLNPKEH